MSFAEAEAIVVGLFAMFSKGAAFADSKLSWVGRGSVGGISSVGSSSVVGQLVSISCSFFLSFFAIGESGAKRRVLPDELM